MHYETFAEIKRSLKFDASDAANLKELAPILSRYQQGITDYFYEILGQNPETAKLIVGRIDALKRTHGIWFQELFNGKYEETYFESRWRIGLAHVRIGLSPYFVELVMSIVRAKVLIALANELPDSRELAGKYASVLKVLDLDLMVINLAYQEERLERLTRFTGMKRVLIENVIRMPEKR